MVVCSRGHVVHRRGRMFQRARCSSTWSYVPEGTLFIDVVVCSRGHVVHRHGRAAVVDDDSAAPGAVWRWMAADRLSAEAACRRHRPVQGPRATPWHLPEAHAPRPAASVDRLPHLCRGTGERTRAKGGWNE